MTEPAKVHGSQSISMCQSEKSKNKVYTIIKPPLTHSLIIDMSSRTLRYKRKTTDRQQTDTEADLERKHTEVDVGQLPSDEELLDVIKTSYEVIKEHGRGRDFLAVLQYGKYRYHHLQH